MKPLLILSPFMGTPENVGVMLHFLRTLGHTRIHGLWRHFLFCPLFRGPPRTHGLRRNSAQDRASEKAWIMKPLLILSPLLGTPGNSGVVS